MKEVRNHLLDKRNKYKYDDSLAYLYEFDIDIPGNEIYLGSIDRGYGNDLDQEPGVDFLMANRFIRNIRFSMKTHSKKDLLVHQNTCGGDWDHGMAIYDAIRAYPNCVTGLAYSSARSMSSIILQAYNKRVLMPHASFMLHMGSYGDFGTQKEVESNIAFYKKSNKVMIDIYASRMKESGSMSSDPITKISAWLQEQMDKRENVWLTAQEAVELGLADEVFDYNWKKLLKYTEEQKTR